jgi:hypothetical protein
MKKIRTASLFAGLALASCSSGGYDPETARRSLQDMRDYVGKNVPEPARSTKLLGLIDAYEASIAALNEQLQAGFREFRSLNADYDAPPERLLKAHEDFVVARRKLVLKALDVVQGMKASTSAEEWKDLAKLEEKALKANLRLEDVKKKEGNP